MFLLTASGNNSIDLLSTTNISSDLEVPFTNGVVEVIVAFSLTPSVDASGGERTKLWVLTATFRIRRPSAVSLSFALDFSSLPRNGLEEALDCDVVMYTAVVVVTITASLDAPLLLRLSDGWCGDAFDRNFAIGSVLFAEL